MTVTKKFSLLIFSALLGILALAGVGYTQMDRVFEAANYANINTVPSILTLDKAVTPFAGMRIQVWQYIATDSEQARAVLEKKIIDNRAKLEAGLREILMPRADQAEISRWAREQVEKHFDVRAVASQIEAVYQRALSGSRPK